MRKKIKILLLIVLLLNINANKISAYTAEGEGTGTGVTLHGGWCGPGMDCYGGYSAFEVRITLLNEKLERVEGTKVIEFGAMQPASGWQPSVTQVYDIKNVRYQKTVSPETSTTWICINHNIGHNNICMSGHSNVVAYSSRVPLDYSQRQITFLGTGRTRDGMLPENTELNRHYVYMGFGDTVVEDVIDGANIPNLRSKFMDYITSLDKKNYVEGYGNVSFIDYFLHVSGFSESWEASKDYNILKKIKEGHYYLMIEPVHHPAQLIDGIWYGVEGTSQQLAEFSWYNYNFGINNRWSYYKGTDYLHNAFCNFMDSNSILTKQNAQQKLEQCQKLTYDGFSSNQRAYMKTLSILAQANMGYGITMVDLNQKWKELTDINECVYDIDTCNDNDFIFEVKFSALDDNQTEISSKTNIASCIYGMDEQNREKYYYTATSATGKKLYCYDDLTYDFKNLKKLEDQNFKTNTFAKIENGVLNVDRTCFSTTKFDDTTQLNNILVDDNIGSKQYQEEFTFNFLGKNYTFKRDDTINSENYNETEEKNEKGRTIQYTYTSSFSYYYKLEQGFNTDHANILINDYSINNGLPSKNSIYINKDSSNAKVINVSQKESNKYTNILNSQLNNGYGLNTKTIEVLNSNPETIINSETNINRKGTVYSTESKVNLHIVSDNNNECKFDATVTNTDGAQFRVISLSNPFPARDGTSRIPGKNWLNESENNVYEYIQNNRNVNSEHVYQQEPLYTVTLDTKTMIKIREYNKTHTYSDSDITCETGTGRMCIDNFIRNDYINLAGVCKDLKSEEMPAITQINKEITNFIINRCAGSTQCMQLNQQDVQKLDNNKDGYVDEKDYLNSKFYTCADKTAKSGG